MTKSFKIAALVVVLGVVIAAGFAYKSYRTNLTYKSNTSNATYKSYKTYSHAEPHFTFNYPTDMNASTFQDEQGQTVLLQVDEENRTDRSNRTNRAEATDSAQIYISDFDEDIILTEERIKQDVPDTVISQPKTISLGQASGVAFFSQDESLGQTYEVWAVYKKQLYQIMSKAKQKNLVDQILASWKF